MQRPARMDEIVQIMTNANHENRPLTSEENKELEKLLQNIFHKQQ